MNNNKVKEIVIFVITTIIISVLVLSNNIYVHANTEIEYNPTEPVPWTDGQHIHLKATEVVDKTESVEGAEKNQQLILELWATNIEFFKGFELSMNYKTEIAQLSNINTNNAITSDIPNDEPEFFKFDSKLANFLEVLAIPNSTSGTVRMAFNLIQKEDRLDPNATSNYIKDVEVDEDGEKVIKSYFDATSATPGTTESVLIGKMSMKISSEDLADLITLQPVNGNTTGIKLNIDAVNSITDSRLFKYTVETASDNAYLKKIQETIFTLDEFGIEDIADFNKDNATYQDIDGFLSTTYDYTITLEEYKDYISIIPTLDDENASMTLQLVDKDGNLILNDDGTTPKDKRENIESGKNQEIKLNELGKEDTIIELVVTSESGKVTNKYKIKVHRPYGIIKGSLTTVNEQGIHKADIKVYKSDEVATVINWTDIKTALTTIKDNSGGDLSAEVATINNLDTRLKTLNSIDKISEDDGTYQIIVIPGKYDVLLDKTGYLNHIYDSIVVEEYKENDDNTNNAIDLKHKDLIPGDTDKNGFVDIVDMAGIQGVFGGDSTSPDYGLRYDFNEDGYMEIVDMAHIQDNFDTIMEIGIPPSTP